MLLVATMLQWLSFSLADSAVGVSFTIAHVPFVDPHVPLDLPKIVHGGLGVRYFFPPHVQVPHHHW